MFFFSQMVSTLLSWFLEGNDVWWILKWLCRWCMQVWWCGTKKRQLLYPDMDVDLTIFHTGVLYRSKDVACLDLSGYTSGFSSRIKIGCSECDKSSRGAFFVPYSLTFWRCCSVYLSGLASTLMSFTLWYNSNMWGLPFSCVLQVCCVVCACCTELRSMPR